MFCSEDGSEILRVDLGEANIPSFGVDVRASSKSIGLGTKLARTIVDEEVELGEVLRPSGLTAGKHLRGSEVF